MNAHTFDTHSPTCPICHRAGAIKPHKLLRGLLTCQYCRERLVVSWSGHYVRDPFTLKHISSGQMLRRESHPLARIRRDVRLDRHSVLLVILGSAVFLGTAFTFLQNPLSLQKSIDRGPSPSTSIERPLPPS